MLVCGPGNILQRWHRCGNFFNARVVSVLRANFESKAGERTFQKIQAAFANDKRRCARVFSRGARVQMSCARAGR